MAKTPPDLTQKWWHDNKPVTMKSTGLGQALADYATAWKTCTTPFTRTKASIQAAIVALQKVKTQVDQAKTIASQSTLNKDTSKTLDGYGPLIAKESQKLQKHGADYEQIIKDWADVRKRCHANMLKGQKEMAELAKKTDSTVKTCDESAKSKNPQKMKLSVGLAKGVLKELENKQKEVDKALSDARIPLSADKTPKSDDFPADAKDLFNDCVNIQKDIIADRKEAEGKLAKAIKANGG